MSNGAELIPEFRALIVEDEHDHLVRLRRALEQNNFGVRTAMGVNEAVDELDAMHATLVGGAAVQYVVFLDGNVPETTGQKVKSFDGSSALRIITYMHQIGFLVPIISYSHNYMPGAAYESALNWGFHLEPNATKESPLDTLLHYATYWCRWQKEKARTKIS
jgi:CheY-like chemotaxis protein